MDYELVLPKNASDYWVVEAIDYGPPDGKGDGEILRVIFSGYKAEQNAKAYAALMNSGQPSR